MKPEPYFPPLPRPLTEQEAWFLEVSAAGGVHAFRIAGAGQFRTARTLVKMGLAELDGRMLMATPAGLAAIRRG